MAQAYHHFAATNHQSWRGLFDIKHAKGEAASEWYLTEVGQPFSYFAGPLGTIFPTRSKADQALLTRALFSSVHGIVLLGLDQANAGVPSPEIDQMIALVLRLITQKQHSLA